MPPTNQTTELKRIADALEALVLDNRTATALEEIASILDDWNIEGCLSVKNYN